MQYEIIETKLPGCFEVLPRIYTDERGTFVKTFHEETFEKKGLETYFAEDYYSFSSNRVLRGLHFHLPPKDHVKLVYCVSGRVQDAVVDLRVGSPTFGEHQIFEVSAEKANMIYMPKGVAHGFYVESDSAIMMYKVTTAYSPDHDTGILWDSAHIQWPDKNPVISNRDSKFPAFSDFQSPFCFDE